MRFKLLRGFHVQREMSQGDAASAPCPTCGGSGKVEVPGKTGSWDCPDCLSTGKFHLSAVYDAKDPARNIVESDVDLESRFGNDKFQNLDKLAPSSENRVLLDKIARLERENAELKAAASAPDIPDDLSSMTSKQLRELARKMQVDLSDASGKDEMINILQSAMDTA